LQIETIIRKRKDMNVRPKETRSSAGHSLETEEMTQPGVRAKERAGTRRPLLLEKLELRVRYRE